MVIGVESHSMLPRHLKNYPKTHLQVFHLDADLKQHADNQVL